MGGDRPKYCPRCGTEAPEHGQYCHECGADIITEVGDSRRVATDEDGEIVAEGVPPEHVADQQREPSDAKNDDGWSFMKTAVVAVIVIVIGLVAISFTLGFLGFGDTQHEIYSDLDTDREEGTQSVTLTVSGTLPKGRYAAHTLSPDIGVNYEITAEASQPIDVYVMDQSEFDQRYRDAGDEIQFYNRLSGADTTSWSGGGGLSRGDYVLVIDNTGVYDASPDGSAEVDIKVRASV